MIPSRLCLFVALLSCLFLAVCCLPACKRQNLPPDLPGLHPVTIEVVQDGQPLAEASVLMQPTGASKWAATGATNAEGKAIMRVNGRYDGVPLGEFRVIVRKTEKEKVDVPPPPPNADPQQMVEYDRKYAPIWSNAKTFTVVDTPFADLEMTPLKVTVVKGKNQFPLDVGKAVRIEVKRQR